MTHVLNTLYLFSHLADFDIHYPSRIGYESLLTRMAQSTYPWLILADLNQILTQLTTQADITKDLFIDPQSITDCHISKGCLIEKGAVIEPFVTIKKSCYIARRATIRSQAYLRESVFVGPDAVVGHSTEVKHSILLAGSKASHHCYVGDSILGYKANLGAGTTTANVRFDRRSVMIKMEHDQQISRQATGLKKLGCIFGDDSQTGCQVVTNPGAIVPAQTHINPSTVYG